jgi:hypothetical protein
VDLTNLTMKNGDFRWIFNGANFGVEAIHGDIAAIFWTSNGKLEA